MKTWIQGVLLFMVTAAAVVTLSTIFASEAEAVPAFARKYEQNCTQCHIAFPKLNDYGMKFRQNGYRDVGEVGEDLWKKALNVGGLFQFGALDRTEEAKKNNVTTKTKKRQIEGEQQAELFFGGPLGKNISYFAEMYVGENKVETEPFLILDDILPNSALNFKIGAFHMEFPWLLHSVINKRPWGTNQKRIYNAAGTKINNFHWEAKGAEINGLSMAPFAEGKENLNPLKLWYAVGVFNGQGTGENKMTDLHLRGLVTLNQHSAGIMYLRGEANNGLKDYKYTRMAISGDINIERLNINPGFYIFIEDDIDGTGKKGKYTGPLLEVTYPLTEKGVGMVLAGRYEALKGKDGFKNDDLTSLRANLTYYFVPNMKLALELTQEDRKDNKDKAKEIELTQLVAMFGVCF